MAEGRRRFRERSDRSRFPGGAGWGRGRGLRGGEGEVGREPPPRACGPAPPPLPLRSLQPVWGHFVCVPQCSAQAARLGGGGEVGGRGSGRGGASSGAGKQSYCASAEGVARGCPELNCWGVCLLIHRGFRHCLHLCVCAHVQIYIHMLHKLCPTCPSSSCPLSQVPACTDISISRHGLCFWNFFF